jgi:hypothetical protein
MGKLYQEYKNLWNKKEYKKSLFQSILLLLLAAIASSIAIGYADVANGSSLGDLLLDNLPQINFFWFRTWGTAIITISIITIGFLKPKYLPALAKTEGLMYIIRAIFISLTPLKHYPLKTPIPNSYFLFNQIPFGGNDLFFSGHVAFPFIATLIFWENKKLRKIFISFTILSGTVALLAKTHYSIDIFAAPFISYSIFKISEKIFKKDFKYFKNKL